MTDQYDQPWFSHISSKQEINSFCSRELVSVKGFDVRFGQSEVLKGVAVVVKFVSRREENSVCERKKSERENSLGVARGKETNKRD